MAGYICALIISLFAVVAGIFCMLYPFYHKMVCKISTTATVIDIREKWSRHSDGTRDHLVYYPVFQYRANGEMITIEHNVSPRHIKLAIKWKCSIMQITHNSIISPTHPVETGYSCLAEYFSS